MNKTPIKIIAVLSCLAIQGCLLEIGPVRPHPSPDAPCHSDWDCPYDTYCEIDGFCYKPSNNIECYSDRNCPMFTYCGMDGYCYQEGYRHYECYSDWDCPVGYFCAINDACYLIH